MRTQSISILLIACATAAHAQLGDILKRLDPSKVKKTVDVARAANREFTEGEEADIGRVVPARVLSTPPLPKDDKSEQAGPSLVTHTAADGERRNEGGDARAV